MGYMAVGNRTLELTKIAAAALAEKLGSEIVAIDLSEQLVLNQVFLLVTGNNEPQLQALSEEVQKKLAQAGEKPIRKEGSRSWVLLDYTDLVVHIQSTELRNYYMLDRLWNDCPKIDLGLEKSVR
ncbi:MAG: ribosome-associated protein [Actinomycetota bacterium]